MEHHHIRRSAPEQAAGFAPVTLELADARHRDGMSCENPAAYKYDANGHQRWCIDCDKPLGEQSWATDGADVGPRFVGVLMFIGGILALVLLVLLGLNLAPSNPYPGPTPATIGGPR